MSDVLIKGMEMPKSPGIYEMLLFIDSDGTATVEGSYGYFDGEPFKAIHVQASRGNLIDEAELWVEINKICDRRDAGIITDLTCLQQILSALRRAPTIILAESITAEEEKK